jgi:hypothetical protein
MIMNVVREGLSKVTIKIGYGSIGFSCKVAISMGKETVVANNDMPTHVGVKRETNCMFFIANLTSLSTIGFLL